MEREAREGMSVITRFTGPDEAILLETRPHAGLAGRQLLRAVLGVAVCGGGVVADLARPAACGACSGSRWRVMAALAVLGAARAVWRWDRTVLAVTSEQIVLVRGGSRRSAVSLPLEDVRRLGVDQSVPGRMLGYGTLILADGESPPRLRLRPPVRPRSAG